MKIYISSHDQIKAQKLAGILKKEGHEIISSWVWLEFLPTEKIRTDSEKASIASRDVSEVQLCDALYHIAGPDRYPGGKFVEVGVALGLGKPVFCVGRRENCLMHHPLVIGVKGVEL